ncbi:MAG: methyltransferase domain-containing protein [Pirellulales bacterium]|nr:methyltransferase domain-containing protein [Pirellulales bacterium]
MAGVLRRRSSGSPEPRRPGRLLNQLVEHKLIRRLSFAEYRGRVRRVYDGPQGALQAALSRLSGHYICVERLFRDRHFDLRGVQRLLDAGCGSGQLATHVSRYADPGTQITCCDISAAMVRRARRRLRHHAIRWLVADLAALPFANASFDCVTCSYVLEHLPDARLGLAEIARVLVPGGKALILTSEDNFTGAMTSRFWCSRTYNRAELAQAARDAGLIWVQELWLSPLHRLLRAGGICVVMQRQP